MPPLEFFDLNDRCAVVEANYGAQRTDALVRLTLGSDSKLTIGSRELPRFGQDACPN